MIRTAAFYESRSNRYLTAERLVSGFSFTTLGASIRVWPEDWTDAVLTKIDAEEACDRLTREDVDNAIEQARLEKIGARRRVNNKVTEDHPDYWVQLAKPGTYAHQQYSEERELRRQEIASRRSLADDLELQSRKRWF